MTRINVVPPSDLVDKHLMGELHEILRVHGLVRKAQDRGINKWNMHQKLDIPHSYTMGTGHVLFFYDKLGFVTDRYYALCREAKKRGFKPNVLDRKEILKGIDKHWLGSYAVTKEAIKVNRARLDERLGEMGYV